MQIVRITNAKDPQWLEMRLALWPENSREEHQKEMQRWVHDVDSKAAFFCLDDSQKALGFSECTLREYANGCHASPVGFIEGVYVRSEHRRLGVATWLVGAAESWAIQHGCSEMGSDAQIENQESRSFHARLRYTEASQVVCFRKELVRIHARKN
jgi:aminoglycoside 6'-N-acetyltransferase I